MSDVYGVVYEAHDKYTNKKYIGQTTNFKKRIKNHKDKSKGKGYKSYFNLVANKRWDFIKWRIIGECYSQKELDLSEIECISFYKSNDKLYGYNIKNGGGWRRKAFGYNKK